LKPCAFKPWVNWIQLVVQPPPLEVLEGQRGGAPFLGRERDAHGRQLLERVTLGVAVQVAFESKVLKAGNLTF
jgi:hypothetical protein